MKLVYLVPMQNKKTGKDGFMFTSAYGGSALELRLDTDGLSQEDLYRAIPVCAPTYRRDKLNFPTKDCAPYLCAGPAEVEVVSTKDNYNFFSGRMLQFVMPSDEKLCEFIYAEKMENATFIRKVNSIRGDYIVVVTENEGTFILVGEELVKVRGIVNEKDNAVVKETFVGKDFLCKTKQGCDFATFAKRFRTGFVSYEYGKQYASLPITYVPDDRLGDWMDNGIVTVNVHTHRKQQVLTAKVYTTDEDLLIAANLFSPSEVDELFAVINEMNSEANAVTKAFIERKR